MQKRIADYIGERAFDADLGSFDAKLNVFAQLAGNRSAGAQRRALQNFARRNEAQPDEPLFERDESPPQVHARALVKRERRRLNRLGQGIACLPKKFARTRNQIIEQWQVNADGGSINLRRRG
jgi:hypothetical protein